MAGVTWFPALLSILSGITVALVSGYISQIRENQRWVKEEVYRPLHGELVSAANGDFPREGQKFRSKWATFDRFQRLHIDKELGDDLDEYSQNLQSLNELKEELKGSQELLEMLPEGLAESRGSDIILVSKRDDKGNVRAHIQLESWLDIFGDIVVEASNPVELRDNLIEYSEKNSLGHERNFRKWDDSHPDWPENFWEAFRAGDEEWVSDLEQIEDLKQEIAQKAMELRDKIEKRIKEGFMAVLIRKARR